MWISRLINQWAIALFTLMASHSLYANCQTSLVSLDAISSQNTYDVFATGQSALVQNYRLRSDIQGEECSIEVELDLDKGASSLRSTNQQQIQFEWQGSNGYQKAGRWYITLSDSKPVTTFQIKYPAKQWLDAGRFSGELKATLSGTSLLQNQSEQELPLNIEAVVLPSAKIQFYGLSQQHYDLDIGELTANKVIHSAPKLWVQSTASYSISIESMYRGVMRHQSADTQWDIAYQMLLDNQPIELSKTSSQWHSDQATSGRPIPITFIVGDTTRKPGGIYNDTLYISIEPNLAQQP